MSSRLEPRSNGVDSVGRRSEVIADLLGGPVLTVELSDAQQLLKIRQTENAYPYDSLSGSLTR